MLPRFQSRHAQLEVRRAGRADVDHVHIVAIHDFRVISRDDRNAEIGSRLFSQGAIGIRDGDNGAAGVALVARQVRVTRPRARAEHRDSYRSRSH